MALMRTINGYGTTQVQVIATTTTTTSMTYTQALQTLAALIPDYVYEDKENFYWLKANNQTFILSYNPSASYAKGFTSTFLTGTTTSNAHSYIYTFYVYKEPTSCTALKVQDGVLTNIAEDNIASTFAGTWQLFKYI